MSPEMNPEMNLEEELFELLKAFDRYNKLDEAGKLTPEERVEWKRIGKEVFEVQRRIAKGEKS